MVTRRKDSIDMAHPEISPVVIATQIGSLSLYNCVIYHTKYTYFTLKLSLKLEYFHDLIYP